MYSILSVQFNEVWQRHITMQTTTKTKIYWLAKKLVWVFPYDVTEKPTFFEQPNKKFLLSQSPIYSLCQEKKKNTLLAVTIN